MPSARSSRRTANAPRPWSRIGTTAYAGAFVRLDITGTSGLGDGLTAIGLVQVDTVVTMARNGVPAQDEGLKQFVILNQSLF